MPGWLIVVDRTADLPAELQSYPVMTTRDYIMRPRAARRQPPKVLNLSRDYGYQTQGYYCSLLAEARGHKVVPTVATMLELRRRNLYAHALPELEDTLNRILRRLSEPPQNSFRLLVCLGHADDTRFERFGRLLFDWLRAPILEVFVQAGEWWRVRKVAPVAINELGESGKAQLVHAIHRHFASPWRSQKVKVPPRHTLGVLFDAKDKLPPSELASIRHFARIAEPMGVSVEMVTGKDFDRIPEFDGLWIRETTNIDHHTYRFAKRAEQEGMPVIDDPTSIVRCTNKVYLAELLTANQVPTPKTVILSSVKELDALEQQLAYPIVVKIPDGSFSRGVTRVRDRGELERQVRGMLEDSDLILAQEFMPTEFDWRVGVLDGEPLFVTQYLMAKKHWQIVHHRNGGRAVEGGFRTVAIAAAPREVVDAGVRAARLIGNGLYGVDIKQSNGGVFVIEVNDNPNLNHDVEDAAEGDAVWRRLAQWFVDRLA
jgi:glutathione synthase/RimK-type ligase-like ATP-grasp enzyme